MNKYHLVAFTTKLELWDAQDNHPLFTNDKIMERFEAYRANPATVFATVHDGDRVIAHYAR